MDLYFELYSGIAGDMTIGALLDLGASREKLEHALNSMDFGEYELVFERTLKKGIDAYNFDVLLKEEHHHSHEEDGHCHNYEGHEHHHSHEGHEHCHNHEEHEHCHNDENHEYCHNHEGHEHHHSHEEDEHHHNHEGHHVHRNLDDIIKIIDSGDFSENAKKNAKKIFNIIADAESIAHGVEKSEVHFHEVGAIDSIIDIVGVCVLIDDLNPEHIYSSELFEGVGFVKCAHGSMPVPAPAVLNIIRANNLSLNIINDYGEHITPTGAAIIACFSEGLPEESFKIKNIGIGAGNREFENSTNILRVMEIESAKKKL